MRIAVVASHPINYFCAQYRSWEQHPTCQLQVIFGSSAGILPYYDAGFDREVAGGPGLIAGFSSIFLDLTEERALSRYRRLARQLEVFRPDLVIVHGYARELQRNAFLWCLRSGVKSAYVSDSELRQPQPLSKRLVKRGALPQIFKRVDAFLTVGDANEEYYRSMGVPEHKLIRMHFPIDYRFYDGAFSQRPQTRARKRAELGLTDDTVLIVMVGKLTAQKSQSDLIAAVQQLATDGLNVGLVLLGSGPLAEEYARTAQGDRVTSFAGFVTPEKLPDFYAATDIYVHASRADPHPLAVSEATAMGLPLIASRALGSWGPTDDLAPFVNGFVYESGSVTALSAALRTLVRNPELRATFATASRTRSMAFQRQSHQGVIAMLADRLNETAGASRSA